MFTVPFPEKLKRSIFKTENLRVYVYEALYVVYVFTVQIAFTTKNNFGKEERELQWVQAQRTLHGLHPVQKESQGFEHHDSEHHNANNIADQAKRRAEIARYAYIVAPMS